MPTPKRLHVKPARSGLLARDPRTRRQLPPEGGAVPDNNFWRRRLRSGDVVPLTEAEIAALAKSKADAKAAAKKAAERDAKPAKPAAKGKE